jgi:activator of HSP90 ATPase
MKNEFTISAVLKIKPDELCRAWLDSKEHSKFTGSPAKISPKVGGKFTAWDGYISGTTIEISPGKRIVQEWRTTEFSDDTPDSKIEVIFEKADKGTKLILRHYEIPKGQEAEYRKGWKDFYFEPMKEYYSKPNR